MIPTWAMSNSTYSAGKAPARGVRATLFLNNVSALATRVTHLFRRASANNAKGTHAATRDSAIGTKITYVVSRTSVQANTACPPAHVVNVHARNKRRMWPAARMLFLLLAFALLFGGLTFMRSFASADQVPPASAAESVLVVDSGDTLWSVATAVKQPSMDTRHAVHMIMKRNQLPSATLEAGQLLIIPAEMKPHK